MQPSDTPTTDPRGCTCYPGEAPIPCERRYALSECRSQVREAKVRHMSTPDTTALDMGHSPDPKPTSAQKQAEYAAKRRAYTDPQLAAFEAVQKELERQNPELVEQREARERGQTS